MELSQVGSMVDLINFFWERDADKDGRLEAGEFAGIDQYDRSGNHALVPWEVMEAVNSARAAQIFDPQAVNSMLVQNADGKTFPLLTLTENTMVEGLLLGSWVQGFESDVVFNDNGQLAGGSLAANTNIDGIVYRAGPALWSGLVEIVGIRFHDNGKIAAGMPVSDVTIDGITYESDPQYIDETHHYMISFFRDGQVRNGRLVSDAAPAGVLYRGNTWLEYNEDGRVIYGTLRNETPIQGARYIGEISYFDDGKVSSGTLAADKTIHGIRLGAGTTVEYFENGHVSNAAITQNTTFDGITYLGGEGVGFYENGQVSLGTLVHDEQIGNFKFAGDTDIWFYENGHVSQGTLAEEITIDGIAYAAGQEVEFDENGSMFPIIRPAQIPVPPGIFIP